MRRAHAHDQRTLASVNISFMHKNELISALQQNKSSSLSTNCIKTCLYKKESVLSGYSSAWVYVAFSSDQPGIIIRLYDMEIRSLFGHKSYIFSLSVRHREMVRIISVST
jgi:hypothetical protein